MSSSLQVSKTNFFRVGDKHYEEFIQPRMGGAESLTYEFRGRQSIIDRYNLSFLKQIKGYNTFVNIPDNINYSRDINDCFNTYSEISYVPESGPWDTIDKFLKHIFGEHYDLGLDYLQLLFTKPIQVLPILCLVSSENQTGKSTFGHLLSYIFENNHAKISNAIFKSEFNSSYASKLTCLIDESKIDKQNIDKLKDLSTSKTIQLRMMRCNPVEIDFFCKFILCSNDEKRFVSANNDDIRYWVRKVPAIEQLDNDFDAKLKSEVPAFVDFLINRKLHTEKNGRMWFDAEQIETEQLRKVVNASYSDDVVKVLEGLRDSILYDNSSATPDEVFYFCAADIRDFANITAAKFTECINVELKQRRYMPVNSAINSVNKVSFPISLNKINELLNS